MSVQAWGLLALFLTVLLLLAWPLASGCHVSPAAACRAGCWHARPRSTDWPARRPTSPCTGRTIALALLAFNALGVLVVYALQRLQSVLPLNPAGLAAVSPDSAFNTAISFVSNTNWQGYAGETTMSYLTQMIALAGPELFLGGNRHCRGVCAGPGFRCAFQW